MTKLKKELRKEINNFPFFSHFLFDKFFEVKNYFINAEGEVGTINLWTKHEQPCSAYSQVFGC